MARDPRARPQSAEELEAELAAFDAGPGPLASADGLVSSLASSGHLHRPRRRARSPTRSSGGRAPPGRWPSASSRRRRVSVALYLFALLGALVSMARPVVLLTGTERWLVGVVAVAGGIAARDRARCAASGAAGRARRRCGSSTSWSAARCWPGCWRSAALELVVRAASVLARPDAVVVASAGGRGAVPRRRRGRDRAVASRPRLIGAKTARSTQVSVPEAFTSGGPSLYSPGCKASGEVRRSGRVVEGSGLENRRAQAPGVRIPPPPPGSTMTTE